MSMDSILSRRFPAPIPKLKDQVVMVGGHLDSWIAGTGATDNGAGTIVAMEVMRILKALMCIRAGQFALRCGAARRKACSVRWATRRSTSARRRQTTDPDAAEAAGYSCARRGGRWS